MRSVFCESLAWSVLYFCHCHVVHVIPVMIGSVIRRFHCGIDIKFTVTKTETDVTLRIELTICCWNGNQLYAVSSLWMSVVEPASRTTHKHICGHSRATRSNPHKPPPCLVWGEWNKSIPIWNSPAKAALKMKNTFWSQVVIRKTSPFNNFPGILSYLYLMLYTDMMHPPPQQKGKFLEILFIKIHS